MPEPTWGRFDAGLTTESGDGYTADTAVWPPPPTNQPLALYFPFKTEFRFVNGSVPDQRQGVITFSEPGIVISGKTVVRAEIRIAVLILAIVLRVGWFFAYLILEYAFRSDQSVPVPWSDVQMIVTNPKKRRVCIVYNAPNYKGYVKTYSLTTRLDAPLYASFVDVANQFKPGQVADGRIRLWTEPAAWIILGCFALALLVMILLSIPAGHAGVH